MKRGLRFINCMLGCCLPLLLVAIFRTPLYAAAGEDEVLDRPVNIQLEQVSFSDALKKIGEAAKVKFIYAMNPDDNKHKITLHSTQRKLKEILDEVLLPYHISYEVNGERIVLKRSTIAGSGAPEASPALSGQVTDHLNGMPLPNVSVRLQGAATGVTTNADGRFFLHAGEGTTLVFSFIGYLTKTIAVKDSASLHIALDLDKQHLNEVVITALGVQKERKALGYSVTEVDGRSLTEARSNNLMNALEGRVAGVNVSSVATGPGASSNVVIRGVSSINGNSQPLYVIDGVPILNNTYAAPDEWGGYDCGDGIGNINPDDIETISVLKGAAASALYGYRGSKGVILITTKTGSKGKGLGVELNSNEVIESVVDNTNYQYVYGQGYNGNKPSDKDDALLSAFTSWGARLDGRPSVQFDGVERPYSAQKGNIRRFYQTGGTHTNTLSFSKGFGDNGAVRFSISNLGEAGIVPGSGLSRQSFNLNTNYQLDKHLQVDLKANYIVQRISNEPSVSDAPANPNYATLFIPTSVNIKSWAPGYLPDGSELPISYEEYTTNPYFTTNKFFNYTDRNRFIGMANLRYTFDNGLFVQGRVGEDYLSDHFVSVTPSNTAYYPPGTIVDQHYTATERNFDALAGKELKWRNIVVNVSAGANYRKSSVSLERLQGNDFGVPYVYSMSNVKTFATPYYNNPVIVNESLYATADLAYKGFLYVNVTGRNDWYSTLAPGKIHYLYPSVNSSFVFTELWPVKGMDFGKIRIGYADVGGEAEEPYQTTLNYKMAGNVNGIPVGMIVNENIPNKDLRPSSVKELEAGTEMSFLQRRLSLDVSVYQKHISRSIIYATTSVASGYKGAVLNIGEITNNGVEVLITGVPVSSKTFNWSITLNGAMNNNVVKSLAPGQTSLQIGGSRAENAAFIHQEVGKAASQIMAFDAVRDAKGNVVLDPDYEVPDQGNLKAWGSGIDKFTGGVTNDLRYKNVTLSLLVDGKFGGKIFSATNYYAYTNGLSKATLPGREKTFGTELFNAQSYYNQYSNITSQFVYDAGFIKLRQVVLGYSFPMSLFNHKIQSMTLSAVGRNLWTLMKHTPNIDPESNYSNSNVQGLELAEVPAFRSFGLNLNVKF